MNVTDGATAPIIIRRKKKGDFRKLWITRINAGARQHGGTYSKLIAALKNKDIQIDDD